MRPDLQCVAIVFVLGMAACGTSRIEGDVETDDESIEVFDVSLDRDDLLDAQDSSTDPAPDVHDDGLGDVLSEGDCDRNIGELDPHGVEAIAGDDWWGDTGYWGVTAWFEDVPCDGESSVLDLASNGHLDDPVDDPRRGPKTPGTYSIDAPASLDDCALCVSFIECSDATQHYVAVSGTLVIHEIELVGDPWISATLTGTHLVEWDLESGIPVPGGQTLCIDYWRIDEDFFGLL